MKKNKAIAEGLSELRRKAEKKLPEIEKISPVFTSQEEMHRIINELSIHQIELEMQQEELLHSREELESSLERYTELYEFAPLGYLTLGRDSRILEVNLTATKMLRVERSILKGDRLGRFIHPDDLAIFNAFIEKVFNRRDPKYVEIRLRNEDVHPAPGASVVPHMMVRIDAVVSDDAEECRAIFTDITKQKEIEEQNVALQLNLMQAQKMESIGRLAGGVAHDFNNMLQVMLGNLDLLIDSDDLKNSDREIFSDLRLSVLKSAGLTSQLLAFARKQPIDIQVLDFNASVSKTLKMLKQLLGANIELIFSLSNDLWPVKMDSSQIDQIITNLAINSKESIQGIGVLTIETRNVSVDDAFSRHHPDIVPGDYVLLVFRDNGKGMDKVTLDSVFEPFFSTKSNTSSTGLGLATVYGIVKQNNGAIMVSSDIGKGATFKIYLPRYSGKLSSSPSLTTGEQISHGNETILFVEDDKLVRDITLDFLKSFGYTVLVAESPNEARSLSRDYSGTIHLLITDVIMPDMNGRDLALILKKSRPGLKILLISGYADDFLKPKNNQDIPMPFLGKPFNRKELACKVRNILDNQ